MKTICKLLQLFRKLRIIKKTCWELEINPNDYKPSKNINNEIPKKK